MNYSSEGKFEFSYGHKIKFDKLDISKNTVKESFQKRKTVKTFDSQF